MKLRILLALAPLTLIAAAAPPGGSEPQRWAVIVGVSDYQHFGDEIGGDLPGSVNDARNMRNVLQRRWNFEPDKIRMLLDGQASRAGIRAELTERLPAVVRPNDLVVFYFAGHGSQAWDLDGDEDDGLDETLAPYDALRGSTENDITDDELGEWLRGLPTQHVTVILDNCHAGTATRTVTPYARPRTLNRRISDLPRPAGTRGGSGSAADPPVLEIAAAQADQIAVDVAWPGQEPTSHTWGGAFTTIFVRYLWEVPLGTSYEEVFRLAEQELKRKGFAQDPQISSPRGQQQLAAFAVPAPKTVASPLAITAIPAAGTVEIGGGSAAGLAEGTLLTANGTMLRVTRVDAARAHAQVVSASGGAAPRMGTHARIIAFPYPDPPLRVLVADLPAAARQPLAQATSAGSGLILTDDPNVLANLIVRQQAQSYQVLGIDGAIRHTISAPSPQAAASALLPVLEKEQAARRLGMLQNPAHPFPLDFAFSGAKRSFRLAETIEFRVRSGRDGYLTVVDLGTDGTVSVIFPNDLEHDNRVRAGQQITLPTAAMNTEFVAEEPVGQGMVRAFVTERPLNLRSQDGVIGAEAIAQALREAAGQSPLRGTDTVPVGSWATASIVYTITR